jgi:hypothetical protein
MCHFKGASQKKWHRNNKISNFKEIDKWVMTNLKNIKRAQCTHYSYFLTISHFLLYVNLFGIIYVSQIHTMTMHIKL